MTSNQGTPLVSEEALATAEPTAKMVVTISVNETGWCEGSAEIYGRDDTSSLRALYAALREWTEQVDPGDYEWGEGIIP